MQQRFLMIWPYAVFVVGLLVSLQLWPASYWLEVSSVKVDSGHESLNLQVLVDRKIHRRFTGSVAIAINKWEGEWVVVCSRQSGGGEFLANAKLPRFLTLNMWTAGQCQPLEPGFQYTVSKTWTIQSLGLMPDKTVTQTSNAFNIWP